MDGYAVGQRVVLAEQSTVSCTMAALHANDPATVVRRADRRGRIQYLVQFDRADAMYGLYWLETSQLVALT